jgi:hypothetical protein
MTDKQKEKLYKAISNWNEFNLVMDSGQEITLRGKISIKPPQPADSFFEIAFPDCLVNVSLADFDMIRKEFSEQRLSDEAFEEIRKSKVSDMDFNIDDESKTFWITEKYVMNLTYGSDIASAQGWFLRQLKEAKRLFESGYKLVYRGEETATKEEFADRYLRPLHRLASLEDEIERHT